MPDPHTWHKDHNKTGIALVGLVWQTLENRTWTHYPYSMQFWSKHAYTQTSKGYMEAQQWIQHHTKNSSSVQLIALRFLYMHFDN